jgi:hypothetical protein
MGLINFSKTNLPNLRRLFVEARTDAEESAYSRNAVSVALKGNFICTYLLQFYNIVLFMSSVAVFSLVAQRVSRIAGDC